MAEETRPAKAKTEAPQSEIADLRALVMAQAAQIENLSKLVAHESPVKLPAQLEKEREDFFNHMSRELGKTCEQRTQEEAERRWAGDTKQRWSVKVGYMPAITIPARSREEAKGRYDAVMGIRAVDAEHEYQIQQLNVAQSNAA